MTAPPLRLGILSLADVMSVMAKFSSMRTLLILLFIAMSYTRLSGDMWHFPAGVEPALPLREALDVSEKLVGLLPFKDFFPTQVQLMGGEDEGSGAWTIVYLGKAGAHLSVVVYFPEDKCIIIRTSILENSEKLIGAYKRDGSEIPEIMKKHRALADQDPFKRKGKGTNKEANGSEKAKESEGREKKGSRKGM